MTTTTTIMVRTTSEKHNSRTFQRQITLFKAYKDLYNKLAFFDPLSNSLLAKTLNEVIYDYYIFSHGWSSLTLCCTTFRNNTTLQKDNSHWLRL